MKHNLSFQPDKTSFITDAFLLTQPTIYDLSLSDCKKFYSPTISSHVKVD